MSEQTAAPGEDVKTRLWGTVSVNGLAPDLSIKCEESGACYPWKLSIVSTVFWIGETGSGQSNARSAWDSNWVGAYGGVDNPVRRKGFEPAAFRPFENPFYVALPYCDMQGGRLKPEATGPISNGRRDIDAGSGSAVVGSVVLNDTRFR